MSNDDRVKAVSSPHFQPFSPAAANTATGKAQSRLLSSKILASEVARLFNDLRTLLNPPKKGKAGGSNDGEDESAPPSRPAPIKKALAEKSVAVSDDEANEDGEDDGWESGTVQDTDDEVAGLESLVNGPRSSTVETRSTGHESDLETTPPPPPKKVRQEKKSGPAESTFLPSLAVGFVRGDSDSEWSDSEAKVADAERKNRRGQRARRA